MSIFTINYFNNSNDYKALYKFLIIVSSLALLAAYATEYIMKLPPCVLCLYQRYCFLLLILFSIVGIYKAGNKRLLYAITLILFSACLIAGYHASVERGFVKASDTCASQVKIADDLSVNEIKDMLYNKPVASCERAALKFVSLSMAEWNLLLNMILLAVLYNMRNFKGKNYAEA